MEERGKQFLVGLMVVATAIVTTILVVLFGRIPTFNKSYTVYIMFPEAPGVNEGTPVRKNGVHIGRVARQPDLIDGKGVLVTASIDEGRTLYPEERVQIMYSTLGDARLEFVMPPGKSRSTKPVSEGFTFAGEATMEPVQIVADLQSNLRTMMTSLSSSTDKMVRLADKTDALLDGNRDRIERMINQAANTMVAVEKTMRSASAYLDDPELRDALKKALQTAPQLITTTQDTVLRAQKSLDLLDTNLRNIQGFTEPLGQRGPELVNRVEGTLQNIDVLTAQLTQFSKNLTNSQGTLGLLVNNPELYQRLTNVVTNVDEMVSEVRPMMRQLRPILDDTRIFTDKIARHPEILGVRGAIEKGPGLK